MVLKHVGCPKTEDEHCIEKKRKKKISRQNFYRHGFQVEKRKAIILAVKMSPANRQLPNLSS